MSSKILQQILNNLEYRNSESINKVMLNSTSGIGIEAEWQAVV